MAKSLKAQFDKLLAGFCGPHDQEAAYQLAFFVWSHRNQIAVLSKSEAADLRQRRAEAENAPRPDPLVRVVR